MTDGFFELFEVLCRANHTAVGEVAAISLARSILDNETAPGIKTLYSKAREKMRTEHRQDLVDWLGLMKAE